jgi:hypothetical protein
MDPYQLLAWKDLSDFDLLLRLIDFSGLRPVLAHLLDGSWVVEGSPSIPSPSFCWLPGKWPSRWKRNQTFQNLADARYADYDAGLVFAKGSIPPTGACAIS